MSTPLLSDCIREGKLIADAIAALPSASVPPGTLRAALSGDDAALATAAAVVAGIAGQTGLANDLAPVLKRDGARGRTAAWALGRSGGEAALIAALDGNVDSRDNAYYGLAILAASGKASAALGATLVARVDIEIAKAKGGGSGLGEQACRALAVVGHPDTARLCQAVIDGDRFCDRFELDRIKKAVADGGKDRETLRLVDWRIAFAELLYVEPAPEPAKPAPTAKAPVAKPPVAKTTKAVAPPEEVAEDGDEADVEAEAGDAAKPVPIDWKAFLASPEAAGLGPMKQAMGQLGPLLEQLAARAIRANLADLSAEEFAAMLLQVLPQALPPQHVQMALSPQAINGYQALAKYLHRTGIATQGDALLQGVKMVRQAMTEQIRAAGILGGPDYSDPDEKNLPAAK